MVKYISEHATLTEETLTLGLRDSIQGIDLCVLTADGAKKEHGCILTITTGGMLHLHGGLSGDMGFKPISPADRIKLTASSPV
jgi:hypothetical protein